MSKQDKAISRTATKLIINMNIAVKALNATQIDQLHAIASELRKWDEKSN